MKKEVYRYTVELAGRQFEFETGKLAGQAGGAVTLKYGDSMVLATATMSKDVRPGIDFFPLTVDYEERMYAGGRIPGSFFRREGRPGEEAILTARLTDRPLRPLFPKDLRNEVQVIIYSLSTDGNNPMDILAINAASAALMISDIPWEGPIAAVRVGLIDDQLIANPTFDQFENSKLNLRIAGTREAILMVESSSDIISEEIMIAALEFGHKSLQPIIDIQEKMAHEIGKTKREYEIHQIDDTLTQSINAYLQDPIQQILDQNYEKASFYNALDELRAQTIQEFASEDETISKDVVELFEETLRDLVRKRILEKGVRIDGRSSTDIRTIWCEVNVSPRAHGSGLFTRGETQVLTLATLGTPREAQELDNLTPSDYKRYIHHYNFPPFCVGETSPLRGTSRREIGHGALAERALVPVIPPEKEFPYTLRLVSEVLSSNGSSSMASVCGSTLALMDTGVPIKAPVAGVAMGLIKEGDNYRILTDILGTEDHLGDMDFKVAGTTLGITALQMDIKVKGLTSGIMSQALEQAKSARLMILDKMMETIPAPNPNLKNHAPRMEVIQIPIEKIGAVIGPGGKIIRAIQEETGAKIDIDEDGTVFIATTDRDSAIRAKEQIEALTESAEVGRIYTGKVVRITDFGAFVEILPNIDGLVHISQLDTQRVNKVEDVVRRGDEITVMVTDIDETGRIRLSRQAVLEGWTAEEAADRDRPGGGSKSGNRQSGERSGNRRKSHYDKNRR
jgi:polyribonucleotide nucleotidyltransferase